MPHFVYLAECSDGSLYAGTCIDLKAREAKHNDGSGAKYTRGRRPVRFVYHEKCETLSEALRREAVIKKMERQKKMALITGFSLSSHR